MPQPSPFAMAMPASGIRAITNRAVAMDGVIRLEIGEPNFPTPDHIVEAAHRAARDGFTRYTATQGIASLREAWCERLTSVNGCATSPDRLVVCAGAVAGLYATFAAILASGDEILVPDPAWPNWAMMATLLGARAVGYRCSAATGWQPDLAHLEASIGPRTRAVLVNSPGNPTGAVLDAATLAAIGELARRHDLWIVSDECYDAIVFDGVHLGMAAFAEDRTITVASCSKTYAMTGWRVGCLSAPETLVPHIAKVQQATTASVCAVAQKAAEAALTGPQDCVADMLESYRARRDQAVAKLEAFGRPTVAPGGAFYLMLDLADAVSDTADFALRLLEEERVAVAPGSAFGAGGAGSVRIALCVGEDDLGEGLRRVLRAAERERGRAAQPPSPGASGR